MDLGFLGILIDKNKQGWHDTIAGTYVVLRKILTNCPWVPLTFSCGVVGALYEQSNQTGK
jgi:hypothetical protein